MTPDETHLLREKYADDATAPGFAADRARLAAGEPLAYVIGTQPFLGLTVHLDSRPLIPRPETEWWTEKMLARLVASRHVSEKSVAQADGPSVGDSPTGEDTALVEETGGSRISILDLCAGSGAIGCAALATLPNAHVTFAEIDPAHEPTIQKNIRENALDESRAAIRIGDLFDPLLPEETFDLIAANPPYIPEDRALDASVTDFEPQEALFSGSDGLTLIRRIAEALPMRLAPGGTAWIEIDSTQASEAQKLFTDAGFSVELLDDLYGRPRVLVVSSPYVR